MMSSTYALRFGLGAACAASLALTGCAGLRSASTTPPAAAPPPAEVAADPTPVPPVADNAAAERPSGAAPSETTPVPACSCVETKSKPKSKPKPKPIHKEAPPQLPTAPVVRDTPAGGLVDAQVKPMSVSVMSILGKRVQGPKGEDLGRVVDVLADASGRVRVAIIDFGGFLGVGNHRIAVDWPLLRFNPDARDPSLLLSLSREKLQTAPEYKDNPRPQTLMEPPAPAAPPSTPASMPASTVAQPQPPPADSKK